MTSDFEAVEVDTVSGEVTRSLGQLGDGNDPETAEIAENVIDSLWRTIDGSRIVVSECCEPAAGVIHFLEPGERLTADSHSDQPLPHGWYASPSPQSAAVAVIGYEVQVIAPEGERYYELLDTEQLGFPSGSPSWSRDAAGVWWVSELYVPADDTTIWLLNHLDLGTEEPEITTTTLPWVDSGSRLTGLATRADGGLVAVLSAPDGSAELVVFERTGELENGEPMEGRSSLGGYDPTGRFLIYVDGDNTVRWRGGGGSGILGRGYVFASW